MAQVHLKNLTKIFTDQQSGKEVRAVDDLSLDINDGEFLVLVGPSGCGKTTALRMVAGLETSTSGEIIIGDRLVNDVPPLDRDIAMVFQSYALYPHMTVYENMAFGLRLRMLPGPLRQLTNGAKTRETKAVIDKRIKDTAELLGITKLLDRTPKQLSGGQRQRVALGRSIVREPQVFLMDEPLSNLDAKLRVQTRAELSKLHRRLGVTTIYVTHDQVEAMTMGQRIAVMKDGILQQCDTPLELYNHPRNRFVAGFIGTPSMNFLEVDIAEKDGKLHFAGASFGAPATSQQTAALANYKKGKVLLGIRPEDIFDSASADARELLQSGEGSEVEMIVEVIEPMGADSTLFLKLGEETALAIVDADTNAEVGKPLRMTVDTTKFHLFDVETEESIRS